MDASSRGWSGRRPRRASTGCCGQPSSTGPCLPVDSCARETSRRISAISRSPLREALTRLEEEGLVVKDPLPRGVRRGGERSGGRRDRLDPVARRAVRRRAGSRSAARSGAAQVGSDDRGPSSGNGDERHPGQHRRASAVPQALLRAFGTQRPARPLERLGDQAAPVPLGRPSLLQRPARHRRRAREAGRGRAARATRTRSGGSWHSISASALRTDRRPRSGDRRPWRARLWSVQPLRL